MLKIDDEADWLSTAEKSCFGIILPDGWLGRPYDNQHVIEEFQVSARELFIRFDKCRYLRIPGKRSVKIEKDESGRTVLELFGFDELEFGWVPYGEENKPPEIKKYGSGKLKLVAYYF